MAAWFYAEFNDVTEPQSPARRLELTAWFVAWSSRRIWTFYAGLENAPLRRTL